MQAITGNTYPVKEQIRALGGAWNKEQKVWMVPDDKAEQARTLVANAPAKAPMGYYCKLSDGNWGVKLTGAPLRTPASVSVRTKAGAIKHETVVAVVRQDNGATVYRTQAEPGRRGATRRRYECEECGEWVDAGTQCWETGMTH